MVEDDIADTNELNEQQIKLKIELGQKALNEKNFEEAKKIFSSIYEKTNKEKNVEIIDGIVRSLTSDFDEVNQEQECFKNINELYSISKKIGRQDVCDRCDQYFEFCKNKKEEKIFENQLSDINSQINDLKDNIKKIRTKDDIEIDKIKNEIQKMDEKRIVEKNKANQAIWKSILATVLLIIAALVSSCLMMTGTLISNKVIVYVADVIFICLLFVLQIFKIKKLNSSNDVYKQKINRKKEVIKNIENRINSNSNYEEVKKLNEEKIEILNTLEEKEHQKEDIEEKLNKVLVKIKKYENMDKGKVINI